MITAQDIANMKADAGVIISDDDVSIVIRRDGQNIDAQTVRLVVPKKEKMKARRSDAGKEMNVDVLVLGDVTLDIMMGDKFVHQDQLYEIIWVSIEQDAFISAEATIHG